MKRQLLSLILLSMTAQLFAGYCGNLGITITNETDHECVLKNTRLDEGYFQDQIPTIIPSHSTTPTFYLDQDSDGVAILIDYRCGNKIALFYSEQENCWFSAGNIYGRRLFASDVNMEHYIALGSYWSATPGQISWRLH